AFGFDLSPLLARAEELAHLAQQVVADRAVFRKAKEDLTICRRDVRKLISAALDEGLRGDWLAIEDVYIKLVARLPRTPSVADVTDILDEMELLKQEIVNRLESLSETEFTSTNDVQIEQHIQNSKSESPHEFEPRSEKEQGATPSATGRRISEPLKTFPLGIVLKACPQISDFGPGGGVTSWRDLMSAAVVVRSMLGISPSAYQDACEIMGPENAAVAVACILERANLINSAGGYMRDLTRRADRG
ncbi:plasmid replication protein RepC, partial [Shinella sp.]